MNNKRINGKYNKNIYKDHEIDQMKKKTVSVSSNS